MSNKHLNAINVVDDLNRLKAKYENDISEETINNFINNKRDSIDEIDTLLSSIDNDTVNIINKLIELGILLN